MTQGLVGALSARGATPMPKQEKRERERGREGGRERERERERTF